MELYERGLYVYFCSTSDVVAAARCVLNTVVWVDKYSFTER